MAERLIELGRVRIHLQEDEDAVTLLRSLMRYISNQEIAEIAAVSERTVRRWKNEGRLPRRRHARLRLADLIAHMTRDQGRPVTGKAGPKRGKPPRLDLMDLVERLTQDGEDGGRARRAG